MIGKEHVGRFWDCVSQSLKTTGGYLAHYDSHSIPSD